MDLANCLRVFSRTVEAGSISAAARDLGIGQPAASKLLRKLEEHCRAKLFARSPRGIRLTAEGRRLYDASGAAMSSIDAAIENVQQSAAGVSGRLRVHSPFCLGERHLLAIANAFRERNSAVAIDLMLGNAGVDLVGENIDLAFGLVRPAGQGVIQRKVGLAQRILVASPGYVARFGAPAGPDEILDRDLAVTDASLSAEGDLILDGPHGSVPLRIAPILKTNSVQALLATILAGKTIGTAQVMLVSGELASGRLVRVLPDHEIRSSEIYLSYPSTRLLRPVVRAFVDFAVPAIKRIEGID